MIRATRRLIAVGALGFLPALVPVLFGAGTSIVPTLASSLLVVSVVIELVFLLFDRRPEVTTVVPDVIAIGTEGTLECRLETGLHRGAVYELIPELSDELEAPHRQWIDTGESRPSVATFPLRPKRRGTVRVSGLWVRWTGPLGLLYREIKAPCEAEIRVIPDLRAVGDEALRFTTRHDLQTGLKIEQFLGEGTEFDALREWQPGSERRHVDWKASARHARLLTREYRAERSHQIILAFDTGRLMAESLAGIPRLDHAIHAGLHLAWLSLKAQDLVGVFAFDSEPRTFLAPAAGVRTVEKIQATMAGVSERYVETNFTLGLTELAARCRRRSLVVMFTEFADSITAELMLSSVERIARRHFVVFVALRDPVPGAFADAVPSTMRALHGAVVASNLRRDRELVLSRLRKKGILVVDVEARNLRSELIQRYLDVKRRERV